MKRIHDLAPSLPKLLFLPQCTRNRTDPDLRRDLATPSLPTWGNGPGAVLSAGVRRARLRVTDVVAALPVDAAGWKMRVFLGLWGGARCVQSQRPS